MAPRPSACWTALALGLPCVRLVTTTAPPTWWRRLGDRLAPAVVAAVGQDGSALDLVAAAHRLGPVAVWRTRGDDDPAALADAAAYARGVESPPASEGTAAGTRHVGPATVLVRRPTGWRTVGGECLVADPTPGGPVHVLGGGAAAVWSSLAPGRTLASLAEELAPGGATANDVVATGRQLEQLGLAAVA